MLIKDFKVDESRKWMGVYKGNAELWTDNKRDTHAKPVSISMFIL